MVVSFGYPGTTCSTKRTAADVVEFHILTDPGRGLSASVVTVRGAGMMLMNRAKTCVATFIQVGPPYPVAPAGPAPSGLPPAERLFYEMKAQDVIIARLQEDLVRTGTTVSPEDLKALQDRRRQLEQFYEEVASDAYGRRANERERLILRVTRLLGECEVAAPPDYLREVNRYIEQWRITPRFEQAVKRAQQNGYAKTIAAAFMARQLRRSTSTSRCRRAASTRRRGPTHRFGSRRGCGSSSRKPARIRPKPGPT